VVPGFVRRYPDRALLIVTDVCATYCRHCTRRRIVGTGENSISQDNFELAVKYLRENPSIRDILISGGDPLLLSDDRLEYYISTLRSIKSIEIIRIGTRAPGTIPKRITPELCAMLKKYHPLYMSIHFNHSREITEETKNACAMLCDAGIPLGSQTVLLKGINDRPQVMMKLMQDLLKIRVRPYYIYQCDMAPGTQHFRTSVAAGVKIIQSLRGFTTGYAVPTYVIDAPGGGGKVPINPEYVISKSRKNVIFRNYEGKVFVYSENGKTVQMQELQKTVSLK
jgi:lysine 2,3-aminomutase